MTSFHGITTGCSVMKRLFEQINTAAGADAPVLVRGETGTGKELVARALHGLGGRSAGPFRAVNCATFTPELLASELFGHVKGAFTGAVNARPGLFALANKGTVFLDEIAEIPLHLQAQLLRVLEQRAFVPVGGSTPQHVDVRIVSATHRALRREVAQRNFRADLMYRVRVVPLFLPPLREREGDVELLTRHFIEQFNERGERCVRDVTPAARSALRAYPWPGNVRELRNVLEYAYVMGQGSKIGLDDLTPELRGEEPPEPLMTTLEVHGTETEGLEILNALRQAHGRREEAAQILGISRTTLWRKMREYHLEV